MSNGALALDLEASAVLDAICDEHRRAGFPVYSLTFEEKLSQFKRLLGFDYTALIEDRRVRQTMHGLALAWNYQPHSWGVRCGKMHTPMEVFSDTRKLRGAIRKQMKGAKALSPSDLRKALRTFSGTQSVSNFRPTAAAAIYDRFLPDEGGVVWDMSAGFGGRLLGAIACPKVKCYIGTDPAEKTMDGLKEMAEDVPAMARFLGYPAPSVLLSCQGSETFHPEPESLLMCFSSPPYASHEKYSDEPTQSYISFPTPKTWLHGFMKQTLANCHIGLKPEGKLVINIAGVKSYPALHTDFVALADANGWKLEQILDLCLSTMKGTRRDGETHKLEPIFVFRKT